MCEREGLEKNRKWGIFHRDCFGSEVSFSSDISSMLRFSSQLTINTAIVYMHRFYMYHSFTKFNKNVSTIFIVCSYCHQISTKSARRGEKMVIDFTFGFIVF